MSWDSRPNAGGVSNDSDAPVPELVPVPNVGVVAVPLLLLKLPNRTDGSLFARASKLPVPVPRRGSGNEPDIVGVALRLDIDIIDIAEPGRGLGLGLGGTADEMSEEPSVSVAASDSPCASAYPCGFRPSYVMYWLWPSLRFPELLLPLNVRLKALRLETETLYR